MITEYFENPPRDLRTLIVGAKVYNTRDDRRKLYRKAIGVDQFPGEGVDHVLDLERKSLDDLGAFDHVECISVLEHSRRPWLVAQNIQSAMKKGATLVISVPFVWRIHAYPDDYWRMTPAAVRSIFNEIKWRALMFKSGVELRTEEEKVKARNINGAVFFERTEVVGVGVRT